MFTPLQKLKKTTMELTKLLKMLAVAACSLGGASIYALYHFQLKLIYPNTLNSAREHTDNPADYDLPYEELWLSTEDGEKLHAFMLLQDEKAQGYVNKTVMVLCPNAGNIGNALPIVELFWKMKYNVFIYSYRGYGNSTGVSTEHGLKIDADTVMQYVVEHPQLSRSSLVLYGRSLGGAVAIHIASKNYVQVSGVILENTFLSVRKAIPHIFPFLSRFTWLCHQVWNSEVDITKISPQVKMIFLSAELDEIVPPDHMTKLFDIAPVTDKQKKLFIGAHHNDTVTFPSYWDIVQDFIKSIQPVEA